jgi:hypothetical protein
MVRLFRGPDYLVSPNVALGEADHSDGGNGRRDKAKATMASAIRLTPLPPASTSAWLVRCVDPALPGEPPKHACCQRDWVPYREA